MVSPAQRRRGVRWAREAYLRQRLGASERRACRVLGQPRTTQRRGRKVASDEGALRGDIVRLASRFGRYGYRRVTDLLRIEGWGVNHKRVERIWRQEGLKVPKRQQKRGMRWSRFFGQVVKVDSRAEEEAPRWPGRDGGSRRSSRHG